MTKKPLVPEKKAQLEKLKTEVAKDMGIDETDSFPKEHPYMGDLPSNIVGKIVNSGNIGGEMMRRIIEEEEKKMK